jgi:hypothetical protein
VRRSEAVFDGLRKGEADEVFLCRHLQSLQTIESASSVSWEGGCIFGENGLNGGIGIGASRAAQLAPLFDNFALTRGARAVT